MLFGVGGCRAGEWDATLAAVEETMDRYCDLLPVLLGDDAPASASPTASAGDAGTAAAAVAAALAAQRADPLRCLRGACNAALHAAERAGAAAAVRRLTSLMTKRGLPPDTATYNTLLRASLARGEGLPAVQEGWREMQALGIAPNRRTFLALIEAHGRGGDAAGALAAFDAMAGAGLAPDAALHAVLLAACGAAGDLSAVADAYQRLRDCGLRADGGTYLAAFRAVAAWGLTEGEC